MLKRRSTYELGAALTEFALIMPLLIGVVYGSIYLIDVGLFRLKAQEIARYSTWAFAQEPLSDYETPNAEHGQMLDAARTRVRERVGGLYLDLDAARTRLLPGQSRQSASAILLPGGVRNEPAPVLPELATVGIPAPNLTVSLILDAIGLGGTTNDLAAGFFARAGLNDRGLVTGQASVRLLPPIRGAARTRAIGELAAGRGFDLQPIVEGQVGRQIGDEGLPASQTVLFDSWRVNAGYSVLPTERIESRRAFAHVVERFHDEAPKVLPGGTVVGDLLGIVGAGDAGRRVVSRPYLDRRPCGAVDRTRFEERSGQVNPFDRNGITRGRLQEDDAVTSFETLPLFDDPAATCSAMVQALNARGNQFMGCDRSQSRRCR